MKKDIEIANEIEMKHILEISKICGLDEEDIDLYGKYKAKINFDAIEKLNNNKNGKLILTTAITPTPAGEGKSTTTVGLGQAINRLGKRCTIALREPSLGPCFGIKGGAAGGGYSQVVPMEDINLHFTGDIHAIGTAHNLLSAAIDNHIKHGNSLNIDPTKIKWKRVMDMNDRALRNTVVGMGGKANGYLREDGFMITVASEIMAILCLAENISEMKKKFGEIVVADDYDKNPITAKQLNVHGAMAALMKEALKPNLVQTLENTPAIIHGGPFANIAHGCNSILATKTALKMSDFVVTEAGFGADLGAEKFLNIKCRKANLKPDCVVLVATVRALKMHGGVNKDKLKDGNVEALKNGLENLSKHLENISSFSVPVVVAINKFITDTQEELTAIKKFCEEKNVEVSLSEVWEKGGAGGEDLAKKVLSKCIMENDFKYLYEDSDSLEEKIEKISRNIYGADSVNYSKSAKRELVNLEKLGYSNLPVCMAKTQKSISDDPTLLGRPKNFDIDVKEVNLSAGAGFVVVLTGDIMTMPGLPKKPSAELIDIDDKGNISGLF